MKCTMCNYEIGEPFSEGLTYTLQLPDPEGAITVCGMCYVLTNILDVLKEIKEKINGVC